MANDPSNPQEAGLLTIGALSRATGVPVPTLRTWERRYGFPEPRRRRSGHRRYAPDLVPRIRMIREAIERGNRAAEVMGASVEELRALLGTGRTAGRGRPGVGDVETVEHWIELVRGLDGEALDSAFRTAWNQRGAWPFLHSCALPFMVEVGERWSRSDLGVMHEHFASERLRDFLSSCWRPSSDRADGPAVVCASLVGERHTIGLQMAAVLLALADLHVIFLGADTPTGEIAAAALSSECVGVVIGTSGSAEEQRTVELLRELRGLLPSRIALLVGGAPRPASIMAGIVWMQGLEELAEWAHYLRREEATEDGELEAEG